MTKETKDQIMMYKKIILCAAFFSFYAFPMQKEVIREQELQKREEVRHTQVQSHTRAIQTAQATRVAAQRMLERSRTALAKQIHAEAKTQTAQLQATTHTQSFEKRFATLTLEHQIREIIKLSSNPQENIHAIKMGTTIIVDGLSHIHNTQDFAAHVTQLRAIQQRDYSSSIRCQYMIFKNLLDCRTILQKHLAKALATTTAQTQFTEVHRELARQITLILKELDSTLDRFERLFRSILPAETTKALIPDCHSFKSTCNNILLEDLCAFSIAYKPTFKKYVSIESTIGRKWQNFCNGVNTLNEQELNERYTALETKSNQHSEVTLKFSKNQWIVRNTCLDMMKARVQSEPLRRLAQQAEQKRYNEHEALIERLEHLVRSVWHERREQLASFSTPNFPHYWQIHDRWFGRAAQLWPEYSLIKKKLDSPLLVDQTDQSGINWAAQKKIIELIHDKNICLELKAALRTTDCDESLMPESQKLFRSVDNRIKKINEQLDALSNAHIIPLSPGDIAHIMQCCEQEANKPSTASKIIRHLLGALVSHYCSLSFGAQWSGAQPPIVTGSVGPLEYHWTLGSTEDTPNIAKRIAELRAELQGSQGASELTPQDQAIRKQLYMISDNQADTHATQAATQDYNKRESVQPTVFQLVVNEQEPNSLTLFFSNKYPVQSDEIRVAGTSSEAAAPQEPPAATSTPVSTWENLDAQQQKHLEEILTNCDVDANPCLYVLLKKAESAPTTTLTELAIYQSLLTGIANGLEDSINPVTMVTGLAANIQFVVNGVEFGTTQLVRRACYELLKSSNPDQAKRLLDAYNADNEQVKAKIRQSIEVFNSMSAQERIEAFAHIGTGFIVGPKAVKFYVQVGATTLSTLATNADSLFPPLGPTPITPEGIALSPIKGNEAIMVAGTENGLARVGNVVAISSFGKFFRAGKDNGGGSDAREEIIKAYNMKEFLEKTEFGKIIKDNVRKTTYISPEGGPIYKVKKDFGLLQKDDLFYLDRCKGHCDHLEVYTKHGKARTILNLDGTFNATKWEKAKGRRIDIK